MVLGSVDPAKVLAYKFDREDLVFYLRNFGPHFLFSLIFPFAVTALCYAKGYKPLFVVLVFFGTVLFFMGIFVIAMIYMWCISSGTRKSFKEQINKYGYDNLARELSAPDNRIFMLHPDKYETYVVITETYLIFSRSNIIRRDEVLNIFYDYNNPKGDTKREFNPKSTRTQETVRFIRMLTVSLKNGTNKSIPVALTDGECPVFEKTLKDAAGL